MTFNIMLHLRLSDRDVDLMLKAIDDDPEVFQNKSVFVRGCVIRRLRELYPNEYKKKMVTIALKKGDG